MQEVDLLVTLAEIAGVFVGFGALISVRSGGASGARELVYIRSVLIIGVWVVVAGLAPATLGAYDIAGHDLWLACSLMALAGLAVVSASSRRTPEMRGLFASGSRAQLEREGASYALLLVPMVAALILDVLGLFPDKEAALYLSAVVLGLFGAALTLLWLVFTQHSPAAASDPAAMPAPGGPSV